MRKIKYKYINLKLIVLLILVSSISIGYSILSTSITTNGNVLILGGNLFIKINTLNTSTSPSDEIGISLGDDTSINITSENGTFLYEAECDNGYSIDNITTGINSYSISQNAIIKNNYKANNTICRFYSRKLKSLEVSYTSKHEEINTVEEALDYLYQELGYEDLPPKQYEAILISYINESHPEFTTVEDALNYLYERLV